MSRSAEAKEWRKLYGLAAWRRGRLQFLAEHPLCEMCGLDEDAPVEATVVDHIQRHEGDRTLFFDRTNWQALCSNCHDRHKRHVELYGYHCRCGPDGWPMDPNHPSNSWVAR